MRFQIGKSVVRLGKAPFPGPDDSDALSRIARAYGTRRDIFDLRDIIRKRVGLPNNFPTSNAVGSVIGCLIQSEMNEPGAFDSFVAGNPLPDWAMGMAVDGNSYVNSPEELANAVLDELRRTLRADPEKP